MLRPTNDPDINTDNASVHGARPRMTRINEISSNDPDNSSELTSSQIDIEHDIGVCKELSEMELYDKKYDKYGGKFSPEELDYLEEILITSDNQSDGEPNEVIPRPENIPMNIGLRCGGSVTIRDPTKRKRKPMSDKIGDYIKAFEDCYDKTTYSRAMNFCTAGLVSAEQSNNFVLKLGLRREMKKFTNKFNKFYYAAVIPGQFLQSITDLYYRK